MKSFIVNELKEEILLSKYLLEKYPNLSKNVFFKALRNKDIKVNDKRISKDIQIKNLDKLDIYISDELLFNLPKKIDVIYEDNNILVVFKPQGMLSNNEEKENRKNNVEPTLEDLVKKYFSNAVICHRLDRNTAGLVIFAKNLSLYSIMQAAFKNKIIEKNYIALVYGIPKIKHDTLNQYIMLDKKNGYAKVYNEHLPGCKNVVTEYSVINENKKLNISTLHLKIHTGKTHQIRAQLKSIGLPIIGDSKYGKNEINKQFKRYKQMLIAYKYSFNFEKPSLLHYLNNITISLPNEYINNVLNIEFR